MSNPANHTLPPGTLPANLQDALERKLAEIEYQIRHYEVHPPESYPTRIKVLGCLVLLALAISFLWFILYVVDLRQKKKPFWLVKIHRARDGGKHLIFNSQPIAALSVVPITVPLIVTRYLEYHKLCQLHTTRGISLPTNIQWIVILCQAYFLGFLRFQTTLQIREAVLTGSSFSSSYLRKLNMAQIAGTLVIVAGLLPPIILADVRYNRVLDTMGALDKGVNQIYAILNDPAQVKSQVIPLVDSLKGLGSQYRQRAAAVRSPYIATLVLLALFAVLVIILNLYALFLVKIMRKHVLNRARRLSHEEAPQAASVHPQGISIVRADSAESPAAATAATPASLPLKSTPHQFSPTNTVDSTACDNDATLQRVSRDMTFAVPITIAMTIGLGICAVAGARLSNKLSAWSFYEFVQDGFVWIYTLTGIITLALYLYTMIRSMRQNGKVTHQQLQINTSAFSPSCDKEASQARTAKRWSRAFLRQDQHQQQQATLSPVAMLAPLAYAHTSMSQPTWLQDAPMTSIILTTTSSNSVDQSYSTDAKSDDDEDKEKV